MIPASLRENDDAERPRQDSTESRLTALARNLIDTVGFEGAVRYCSSLGWRGVLQEIEVLRRQRAKID